MTIYDQYYNIMRSLLTEDHQAQILDVYRLDNQGAMIKLLIGNTPVNLRFNSYDSATDAIEILKSNTANINSVISNLISTGYAKKVNAPPSHGISFVSISSGMDGTKIVVRINNDKYEYSLHSRQAAESLFTTSKKKPGAALNKLKEYVKNGFATYRKL